MNLPSFYELKYFERVANLKSISLASKELSISQPSLSVAIKKLEENIGLNLFVRSKKGVELTKDGKEFLSKAQKLLEFWDQIYSDTQKKKNDLIGSYKIGVHQSMALYSFGKLVFELMNNFSGLEIDLIHDHSANINEKIINCEVDFGVVVNPVRHPDLTLVKVFEDQISFWKSKNKTNLNNEKSFVLICDKKLNQTGELLKKLSKTQNASISRFIYSNNLEVIAELTHSGAGIGLIPNRVAKKMFGEKLVNIKSLPVFKDEMYLVYRKDFIYSPAFNKLKDEILEKLKCL